MPVLNKVDKFKNLLASLQHKKSNQGLVSKKVNKVIRFSQKVCLKWYIDMNTGIRYRI